MFARIKNHLWGDLRREEVKKFGLLGFTLFFLVGSYWLLRTQKDAAFATMIGFSHQPKAKLLSWVVTIFVILIYSKLVDWFDKNKLIMGLAVFYGLGFLAIGLLLAHPTIGIANTVASPDRLLGWVMYPFTESCGTVMVSLFWSYVTSSTKTESAKKGYPLIIAGAQSGSIFGSMLSWNSVALGNSFLFCMGAFGVMMMAPMVMLYRYLVPAGLRANVHSGETKPKTGMFEGLKILLTRPYVMGILALATFYEVIVTITEFEMKMLATQVYTTTATFAAFNGMYGVLTNFLSMIFALLGTGFLMRHFGLRFCLLLFPVVAAFMVGMVYFMPVLAVATATVIVIKGLSYGLNNPTKEIMYIPTSRDVRFKAKGWIDQFGSRSAKASGATINNMFAHSMPDLFAYGTVICLGLVGVWFMVAMYVGNTFTRLTKNGEVVE